MNTPVFNRPISARTLSSKLRVRLAAEDGLSIVEVAVSGLLVGLIALSLIGLDAAGHTAQDQRGRAQAFAVAQADQERIKGLSADQIANLDQTRTVTLDGDVYTVTSTGQFLNSAANTASCATGAAAADYAKITSTVDWPANQRADVVIQSTVTPRAGGALMAQTVDQNANPLSGVRVNVAGSDQSTDAVRRFGNTDAGGCVIFGTLLPGDYTVSPVLAGYVDAGGDPTPDTTVTTTAGNTTAAPFTLGQAGRVTAQFETTMGGTTLVDQFAPSVSWFNSGMPSGINRFYQPSTADDVITTPQELFPFYVSTPGNYAANYNVWAGKCIAAQPPAGAFRRTATVAPGATWTMNGTSGSSSGPRVAMPGMDVRVTYAGTPVKPAHIKLTDSCGQVWQPPISSAGTVPTTGWLARPGQPYGTYTICADYRFNPAGSSTDPSNFKKFTLTSRPNTDFANANSTAIAITALSTTGFC